MSYKVALKILPLIERRISLEELSSKLAVSRATVKRYVKALSEKGLIKEALPEVYELSELGRLFIESIKSRLPGLLSDEQAYVFTDPVTSAPLQLKARSIQQLYVILKYRLIPGEVFLEHLNKGYISQWLEGSVKDSYLATLLKKAGSLEDAVKILEEYISTLS
ncbi:MAG: HTH domain-containing protein [Sulfolobales archaeon]|nr:HTH domain-containing protein [Sulfolobales archaeon]MCX8199273.1 HTH domain-containing protein [Sulfolobales archaeon]MDW8170413.1 HTH domain-containing protein [Desulfurococcaceae archaeon]